MKNSLTVIVMLLLATSGFAQEKYYQINYINDPENALSTISGSTDSASFVLKVQQAKNDYLSNGHLLANIDRMVFKQDSMLADINIGKRYTWLALGTDNIPEEMLSRAGYRERDFKDIQFSGRQFNRLVSKLLGEAANNGYPFASLQLQDIQVIKTSVEGVLVYEPGPKILYDTLTVYPEGFIKHEYLANHLRVRKGTPFQLKHIEQLENGLSTLPYCQLADSIKMGFENNLCNIAFTLKPVKANKIDALIGFLPNQKQGSGLLVTGYINLHLQNLFKSGKELALSWQQFQQESQKLVMFYKHPNLFKSPLGISLNFDLLKQDTSFLNTDFNIQGFYNQRKIEVSFIVDFKNSSSLASVTDSLALPEFADYKLQQGGARVGFVDLDSRLNPTRGGMAFADFKVGNKKISKTVGIAEGVYDSLDLNTLQFQASIGGEFNQRIAGPFVLHADALLAAVINQDNLFTNDLLRLGGVNSLRGFNDLELFVSSYALARIEARVVMSDASRIFLFYDQAFTNNSVIDFSDQPFGFGAGLMLDTGNGDLQLIYALGVSGQQSLSLAQSKIHIGYVARF